MISFSTPTFPVCLLVFVLFTVSTFPLFASHECQTISDEYNTAQSEYEWYVTKHAGAVAAAALLARAIVRENFDFETLTMKPLTESQQAATVAAAIAVTVTLAEMNSAKTTRDDKRRQLNDCYALWKRKCGCYISHTANLQDPCPCGYRNWNKWCHCPYSPPSGSGSGN